MRNKTRSIIVYVVLALLILPLVSAAPAFVNSLANVSQNALTFIQTTYVMYFVSFILLFMLLYAAFAAGLGRSGVFAGKGPQGLSKQGKTICISLSGLSSLGIIYKFGGYAEALGRFLKTTGWFGVIAFSAIPFAITYTHIKRNGERDVWAAIFAAGFGLFVYGQIMKDNGALAWAILMMLVAGIVMFIRELGGGEEAPRAPPAQPQANQPPAPDGQQPPQPNGEQPPAPNGEQPPQPDGQQPNGDQTQPPDPNNPNGQPQPNQPQPGPAPPAPGPNPAPPVPPNTPTPPGPQPQPGQPSFNIIPPPNNQVARGSNLNIRLTPNSQFVPNGNHVIRIINTATGASQQANITVRLEDDIRANVTVPNEWQEGTEIIIQAQIVMRNGDTNVVITQTLDGITITAPMPAPPEGTGEGVIEPKYLIKIIPTSFNITKIKKDREEGKSIRYYAETRLDRPINEEEKELTFDVSYDVEGSQKGALNFYYKVYALYFDVFNNSTQYTRFTSEMMSSWDFQIVGQTNAKEQTNQKEGLGRVYTRVEWKGFKPKLVRASKSIKLVRVKFHPQKGHNHVIIALHAELVHTSDKTKEVYHYNTMQGRKRLASGTGYYIVNLGDDNYKQSQEDTRKIIETINKSNNILQQKIDNFDDYIKELKNYLFQVNQVIPYIQFYKKNGEIFPEQNLIEILNNSTKHIFTFINRHKPSISLINQFRITLTDLEKALDKMKESKQYPVLNQRFLSIKAKEAKIKELWSSFNSQVAEKHDGLIQSIKELVNKPTLMEVHDERIKEINRHLILSLKSLQSFNKLVEELKNEINEFKDQLDHSRLVNLLKYPGGIKAEFGGNNIAAKTQVGTEDKSDRALIPKRTSSATTNPVLNAETTSKTQNPSPINVAFDLPKLAKEKFVIKKEQIDKLDRYELNVKVPLVNKTRKRGEDKFFIVLQLEKLNHDERNYEDINLNLNNFQGWFFLIKAAKRLQSTSGRFIFEVTLKRKNVFQRLFPSSGFDLTIHLSEKAKRGIYRLYVWVTPDHKVRPTHFHLLELEIK